ncbi:MAG: type II toxin-antitoxin system VapC family toxin [Steroidobacteraceae bacterium]
MIVIDASALLEMLLQTAAAERLMERALAVSERLHAPHLLDIEVMQALRRFAQKQQITQSRARQALGDFGQLLIERHAHQPLLPRIWQLRDVMSAYDGTYVALAEALSAPLLTCDGRLARTHRHRASIELVEIRQP